MQDSAPLSWSSFSGSESGTVPRPARCPEPLCSHQVLPRTTRCLAPRQRALPLLHRSYELMRQTKTLLPASVVPPPASLCRLLSVPAGRWPFPTLSLQSVYRCMDPYPAAPLRCVYPFLPEGRRPHLRNHRFGTPDHRHNATSTTGLFRGCSQSVMFKLPYSLDPQVAPTAVAQSPQGGRAVYTTQWTWGYPHELWYRYVPESGN